MNNQPAPGPQGPIQPPPSPPSEKFVDTLQRNLLWFALSLVVTTGVATTSAFLFLEGRVEKLVKLFVPNEVLERINNEPAMKERLQAERDNKAAQEAAGRQERNAYAAYADAETLARDAKRLAGDLTTKIEQVNGVLDLTQLTRRIDEILAQTSFRQLVISRALPAGAIIPFDTEDCPEGWSQFVEANGRTIVGAGRHTNLDGSGRPLTIYDRIGKTGGREEYHLVEQNIPAHKHNTILGVGTTQDPWGNGPVRQNVVYGYQSGMAVTGLTSPYGAEDPQPVPTIPPFVALNYCKKN